MEECFEDRLGLKRIYEPPHPADGKRILVDRLWPRGVSKESAAIDHWFKDIAPNPELRQWFGHKPERFIEFRKRYVQELTEDPIHMIHVDQIRGWASKGQVTLLYAAKDPVHNHAVVLRDYIRSIESI